MFSFDNLLVGVRVQDRFEHNDYAASEMRVALLSLIEVAGVEICHINIHLENADEQLRDKQLRLLLADIDEICDRKTVIVGGKKIHITHNFDLFQNSKYTTAGDFSSIETERPGRKKLVVSFSCSFLISTRNQFVFS